ncbi:DNA/RNA non-specific endonuclease [Mesorhizobium loti]|uniref:Endonuclease n=2 Tax=Phyllobacteriaceae TaxID=69277 RepID=A0A6M7U6Y3_RHILI|nr:endonuclease [Mesorhizobium sp. Root172]OBQ71479.1 endonuclease [Mesorhizobium loti]QKC72945.1 DNA/RNA non-specific endonuclease [Mesorhizobium loti]QKC91802.1 DNA/RNA non-specific endonuclease [Mesorhizobium sp. NZP2234]
MSATELVTVRMDRRPQLRDMRRLRGPGNGAALETHIRSEGAMAERAARPRTSSPQSFAGRTGFDRTFLTRFPIDLPKPTGQRSRDITPVGGDASGRLDYCNFSVVMCASRRMAMFTAVNIEGARSISIGREDDKWALDGRLPAEAQLGEDLYAGNRLDRGHLVRREDPNWGANALVANADTFHFTNCAPQMDIVNQKTWLGLENYILQNARAWAERCSVFTGPVFGATDLRYRDALIPKAFWKVVSFISDDGRPSSTAYVVEQEKELSQLEAAFGAYKTYQRSVKYVEGLSGLSFGSLANFDGFSNEEEIEGGLSISSEIRVLGDVRV